MSEHFDPIINNLINQIRIIEYHRYVENLNRKQRELERSQNHKLFTVDCPPKQNIIMHMESVKLLNNQLHDQIKKKIVDRVIKMVRKAGKPTQIDSDQFIQQIEQKLIDKEQNNKPKLKQISGKKKDIINWITKKSLFGKMMQKFKENKQKQVKTYEMK